MTLEDAVAAIGRYMLTSTATIARLENLPDEPSGGTRRALACVAAISYGLDPAQFGVGLGDVPAAIADAIRNEPRGGGRPSAFVPESVDPRAAEAAVNATGATIHFRRNPGGGRRETRRAA